MFVVCVCGVCVCDVWCVYRVCVVFVVVYVCVLCIWCVVCMWCVPMLCVCMLVAYLFCFKGHEIDCVYYSKSHVRG